MSRRSVASMSFLPLGLALLACDPTRGVTTGAFVWNQRDVETARALIAEGKYVEAAEALKGVDADAPEVHLARAVALLGPEKAEQADPATSSLDQAYRLVAEQTALLAGQDAETVARRTALTDLRERVAFNRGLVAAQKQDWAAAVGEFQRALELDPADDDARWNLEVAYFKQHPPCRMRDDDHEPDDNAGDAKPYDPQKGQKRVLCGANEDWYALELPAGTLVQVQVKGKVTPTEDDDDTREVSLALYAPSQPAEPYKRVVLKDDGGGSGSLTVKRLPEAGTWRFQLAGPGRAELAYDVSVAAVPPCPVPGADGTLPPGAPGDDDAEPNNDSTTATALEDGERPNLKACPGNPDWFLVTVPAKEARSVTVKHSPEDGPLVAEVVDPTGVALSPAGPGITVPAAETEQKVLVRVNTATEAENLYTIEVKKPDDGGDDQDKQDQDEQDKQDKGDQDKQDPQDKKDQPKQDPAPGSQPQSMNQVDPQKLIDELDKNEQNPQLQKLLKNLPAVPQMEDY
jgi:hypothetical protein